jgi:hypothetical protein
MEDKGSEDWDHKAFEMSTVYKTNNNEWPIIYGHEYKWIRK